MIIKPYYKWPRLSTLKIGDKVRWREEDVNDLEITPQKNREMVIEQIQFDKNNIKCTFINRWYVFRFEIDYDN